ncbi:MAG TPA: TFIIB-type zinc ribbon-containing protein [Nitrososphaeraceae archaeon]|nr:TFIIB-type zinc ribbon-containing protein [Nitrososphaeraceae archaeon]
MVCLEYCNNCPECHSSLIHDFSKGEFLCQNCGYVVLDEVNDYGPESIAKDFEEKNRNTRASGAMSFSQHDYGLRTEIGNASKDYGGKLINYTVAEQMTNIRKWHSRIRVSSSKERRLSNVLSKISETCSNLSLPKILIETAAMIYRTYEKNNEAKGKSVSCIAAATIYLACKRCSIVRSIEEIVNATGASPNDRSCLKLASKYYRIMSMELGIYHNNFSYENNTYDQSIKIDNSDSLAVMGGYFIQTKLNTQTNKSKYDDNKNGNKNSIIPCTLSIDNYIAKLINLAKLDTRIERLAIDLAHKTLNNLLADGKSPNGLAAAYIYLSAVLLGMNILQIDVSGLAGVTEVTIRNRCKDILCSSRIIITIKPHIR